MEPHDPRDGQAEEWRSITSRARAILAVFLERDKGEKRVRGAKKSKCFIRERESTIGERVACKFWREESKVDPFRSSRARGLGWIFSISIGGCTGRRTHSSSIRSRPILVDVLLNKVLFDFDVISALLFTYKTTIIVVSLSVARYSSREIVWKSVIVFDIVIPACLSQTAHNMYNIHNNFLNIL